MAKAKPAAKDKGSRFLGGLGFWLLSAFLICWAFVLGVLVGQGALATPEQVAWFKDVTGLSRLLGHDAAPPAEPLKDPKLSFYDRVDAQRDTTAPEPPKAASKPQPAKPSPQEEPKRANTANSQDKTAQAKKPQAKPAKNAGFTVQVASFSEQAQALKLTRQLQDGGFKAYVMPIRVAGAGKRYRVRVGPYIDFDAAQGAASRLRLQYKLGAFVTRHDR